MNFFACNSESQLQKQKLKIQYLEEKTKNFKKELSEITRFKKETEDKLRNTEKRLEKIENNFDELQLAIIKKIGTYGEDIKNISNEMRATQNSFSKIIDPLTDNIDNKDKINNTKKQTEQPIAPKAKTKPKAKKSSSKDTFEDYLR